MPACRPGRVRRRLLDELIGVEFLDRRLALDDALGKIEILQVAQALHVDLAEPLLSGIDQRGVILQRSLHRALLAFPFRDEIDEIVGRLAGSSMMSFMPRSAPFT